jgi:transcriptional regulator GlxA family with amidase domain
MNVGILLFDDAEELDFAGPWEVFAMAKLLEPGKLDVMTIAEGEGPVRAAKGLRVIPDYSFRNAPPIGVLVVPGGSGTRNEQRIPPLVAWIRETAPRCTWVTSVCTGALLLQSAGLLAGRRATTHFGHTDALEARGNVTVVRDARWVRDGNVVTSTGVSAGIDMALWLVGQLFEPKVARRVQRAMEYSPSPPYAADV